ncbi:MAG TPA: hypothetical protein VFR97_03425, partial [Capillimicrobium sp.]|nr:hypothetical protein [Capillimicrobium sp.]
MRAAERPTGEDLRHRREDGEAAGDDAGGRGDGHARRADGAVGSDGEREGQVAGYRVEELARQQVAQQQAERRAGGAEEEGIGEHDAHDRRGRVPGDAEVRDEPAPLRDREQHGRQREEEADERREHREQRGRLSRWGRSPVERGHVGVGLDDVEAAGGEP